MVVKHIKKDDFEIIVSKQLNGLYCASHVVKNNESNHQTNLDLESALDTAEYWLDMHEGKDLV